jgi:HD-like signal output (HDOD) protein
VKFPQGRQDGCMKSNHIAVDSKQIQEVKTEVYFKSYPVLAVISRRIHEICISASSGPQDIFAIINADPVLTGIIYSLYHEFFPDNNDDFFGAARIITELNVNTVKNCLINVTKKIATVSGYKLKDQAALQRRSLSTGIISLLMAKQRGIENPDLQKYYCAGLMHDIGSFMLLEDNIAIFNPCIMDVTPVKAGQVAARLWGFPPILQDALTFCHDYKNYNGKYNDVVLHTALAVSFVNKIPVKTNAGAGIQPPSGPSNAVQQDILKRLKLEQTIFDDIYSPFKAELKKIEAFLGVEED